MGKNIVEKIIGTHLEIPPTGPGGEIGIRIDQTLTQDATGTMAYLQFEAMGIPEIRTELSVSYIDHNTIQIGYENADDHRYLQSVARRFGIHLSRPGNGICHQVHLERFGVPGRTLIGSDSHTPTAGALAMLAIGAGGLDVALAMAGRPFYLPNPKVCRIELQGRLPSWVTAKDIILHILGIFTTKGNVGRIFEYGGSGLASLTVPERATIANMGAECGVTTSIFPSDDMTRRFLAAQGRAKDWTPLHADPDAVYEGETIIDLSRLEPLAACPHSPDRIRPIREIGPLAIQQVCIGSCTNSSYKDLATVAEILKGKTVHPEVSLIVAPGSRQVLENITRDGYLAHIIAAGARLMENACGFCIGNSQSPPSGAVSLRTSNRNFYGRSGTKEADVYLVSPETAAASALRGRLTDPRQLGMALPFIPQPRKFHLDDNMIVRPLPPGERAGVEIIRGPNIGAPPENTTLPADIDGEATIKVGDKITTDHIIPAGARMKYRSNIPRYARYVFEILDQDFPARAIRIRDEGRQNIIVAGHSYGQGSSREHAALCPMYLGVRVVLAKSFERIHAANLVNFGILPLIFENEGDYERLQAGDRLRIAAVRTILEKRGPIRIDNLTRGDCLAAAYELTDRQLALVLAGGALRAR
ncbi:MAG: aconitate hydratase [Pseudomonadota bacterium]|nr:aconitate hydratase [Pseudomonadota bacterium]